MKCSQNSTGSIRKNHESNQSQQGMKRLQTGNDSCQEKTHSQYSILHDENGIKKKSSRHSQGLSLSTNCRKILVKMRGFWRHFLDNGQQCNSRKNVRTQMLHSCVYFKQQVLSANRNRATPLLYWRHYLAQEYGRMTRLNHSFANIKQQNINTKTYKHNMNNQNRFNQLYAPWEDRK